MRLARDPAALVDVIWLAWECFSDWDQRVPGSLISEAMLKNTAEINPCHDPGADGIRMTAWIA